MKREGALRKGSAKHPYVLRFTIHEMPTLIFFVIALRDCLVNQSEGEHEGFSTQHWTTLEARTGGTGRKSGH